jgi:hypothetical protein
MTVSRVSVTTAATKLADASTERESLLVRPIDGDVYVGDSNAVTTGTGFLVERGQSLTLESGDAAWAIAAGTVAVCVLAEV